MAALANGTGSSPTAGLLLITRPTTVAVVETIMKSTPGWLPLRVIRWVWVMYPSAAAVTV